MTKTTKAIIIVVFLVGIVGVTAGIGVAINSRYANTQVIAATLANGGFEGTFSQWPGVPEWIVPSGWTPYALEGLPPEAHDQGPLARPEFKEANTTSDANRVHGGSKAAQWFTFYKVHQGGLFQRVKVTPGSWYSFSIWVQAWCSNADFPTNISPGELYVALGIDPDGQTNAARRGVVWTYWNGAGAVYKKITTAPVQATGDYITVFVESWNKYRFKHNDVYVDDAALKLVEIGGTCPTPEPCPPCPTPVPGPDCPTPEPCSFDCDYEHIRDIVQEELRAVEIEIR